MAGGFSGAHAPRTPALPPPTPANYTHKPGSTEKGLESAQDAEHLPRPCGYGERLGSGYSEQPGAAELPGRWATGAGTMSGTSKGVPELKEAWLGGSGRLVFTRLHASRRPPLRRGRGAGPDPAPCALVWRTKTAPQRTCRGGGGGGASVDSTTRQSSKARGRTDQKVLWDGESRSPICPEEGESRCEQGVHGGSWMRSRTCAKGKGVEGGVEGSRGGSRSSRGQDGRGWTLACSLSKRRRKVYTYAVGGVWNTEVQGGPGNPQVGPEDSERPRRGGRDWSWGCKGEGKPAGWTRVGRTFQTEGTASSGSRQSANLWSTSQMPRTR